MKRIIALGATLLMLALAAPLLAQTNDSYAQQHPSSDQANQTTTPSATNPSSTTEPSSSTPTTESSTAPSTDPSATGTKSLPRTASPLPLLAVGAMGTLLSGLWLGRRRRA